jgi:hypothetical protein
VAADAASSAYDYNAGPVDVGVYAEIERLCDGETRLPPGNYDCRAVLTEESFHQSGSFEGNWAFAMACDDLQFEVLAPGTGIEDPGDNRPPVSFALHQNVPNPFNPMTRIRYDVAPGGGVVTLRIFDVSGRLVRTLVNSHHPPGEYSTTWNGKDVRGIDVATGVYFYRLAAPGFKETRKMVLVR